MNCTVKKDSVQMKERLVRTLGFNLKSFAAEINLKSLLGDNFFLNLKKQ